ncbi:serine hydrolase [Clostridium kluyveri]|uniref:Predicted peptidoglycan biosynthesis protein n=2 Tax=Clostridium kluyveri TaxID=1534 RepID=A5N518_CLOK5|nr:serine hydrolase [Clostridium kluyveri]EDK32399.1 Predicted peptidoglycan biosynthesis protein [Clostridium kluyveri DSM 555]BAH05347.1 hypothetical protein CKR_0296 [Clostridium kluyveri NBRC 12016]
MFKKSLMCIFLSILLAFSSSNIIEITAHAESASISNEFTINVDGTNIPSKYVQPYQNLNSVVMLSLNVLCQKLDTDAKLEVKNDSALMNTSNYKVKIENNNKKISANGKNITLTTAPVIKTNIVFVPLEFFSEVFGKTINWDNSTKSIEIYTSSKNIEYSFKNVLNLKNYLTISQKLDNYLSALETTDNFHGSVLVAQNGSIILNKGYGKSDFEQNIKNTQDTIFPIGSMTKQFTAMAIMQLVEKGLINIDDVISKYIPDFPNGNIITIQELLTHSSGIVNCTNLPEFWSMSIDSFNDINNVINLFKNKPLEFQPGSKFSYSNSGYILLGYIVEKVSGINYIDYLEKNIFHPLNMKNTRVGYNGMKKMYTSTGYSGYLDVFPVSDMMTINGTYGAGNLCSTTGDLYKWDRALYTDKLIKQSTLKDIFSNHIQITSSGIYYGYGWMLSKENYGKKIYHGGNTLGFTSNIARYPNRNLTIIILTNVGYYNINSLNDTLADISLGKNYEMPKKKSVIKVDDALLDKYIGNYKIEDNLGSISITHDNGHLYCEQNNSGQKYELFAQSQNKFFLRVSDVQINFNINDKNQVTGIFLYESGQKINAEKINRQF